MGRMVPVVKVGQAPMARAADQSLKAALPVDQMVRGAAIDPVLHQAVKDLIDPIVQLVNFHQVISHK